MDLASCFRRNLEGPSAFPLVSCPIPAFSPHLPAHLPGSSLSLLGSGPQKTGEGSGH